VLVLITVRTRGEVSATREGFGCLLRICAAIARTSASSSYAPELVGGITGRDEMKDNHLSLLEESPYT
jgi:hypothetical protein